MKRFAKGKNVSKIKAMLKTFVPSFIAEYKTKQDGVLLTFDDGPHPVITPKILNFLDQHCLKAVFFIVGREAEKYPELVERIVREGHCLGNHSFCHKTPKKLGYQHYSGDLLRCQRILNKYSEGEPTLFRPPEGRLTFASWLAIKCHGMRAILWSVESGEWGHFSHQTADEMYERLLKDIKHHDVILMHDNNEKVVTLVQRLLPALLAKGINFVEPKSIYPYTPDPSNKNGSINSSDND